MLELKLLTLQCYYEIQVLCYLLVSNFTIKVTIN